MKTLKFFKKNINRDKVYASVEGYQLDLRPVVEKAKQLHGNHDELPSWAKLVANPKKGKGWFITLLEGMFKGKHNLDCINVEGLVDSTNGELSKRRVAMMFFPDNTKIEHLQIIKDIIQETLGGWKVIELNSKTVKNNSECESKVQEIIESCNCNVMIIASKMAQRSFSEELIDELYLAYDRGQDGATIQKMSRALTSNSINKIARIFSLSFDPNRDDKLDTMVFQAALNQIEKKGKSDIREELKRVYKSIDIFSCGSDGIANKLNVDEYVKQALDKKGISRVMGKKSDLTLLTKTQIQSLLNGNVDYLRNEIKERAEMGKTRDSKPKMSDRSKIEKPSENDIEKVREVVISMIEHSDVIMLAAKNKGAKNITEALEVFEKNKWTPILEDEFGVKYEVVKYLFTMGIIKSEWVNLLHG
jgi:transcriptional regulator of heat shock response